MTPQSPDNLPEWKVIGASAPGSLHIKNGVPCQDAHAFWNVPSQSDGGRLLAGNKLVIALADGAGSAEFAAQGARVAVDRAVIALENSLKSPQTPVSEVARRAILQDALSHAQQAVFEESQKLKALPRALACTLLLLFADEYGLAALQLGDGALIAETEEGHLLTLLGPQRGEYANETYFITDENALSRAETILITTPLRMLAAMTDGLIRLALHLNTSQPHEGFFRPLGQFAASSGQDGPQKLRAFLTSPRVASRTHDDTTLVIATTLRSA